MRAVQALIPLGHLKAEALQPLVDAEPQLLLVLAPVAAFEASKMEETLAASFPNALRVGCSTAGVIGPQRVSDREISLTAIQFVHSSVFVAEAELFEMSDSRAAGKRLAAQLPVEGLRNVFVLAPGLGINASALIEGMAEVLGPSVPISGGLAADDGRFEKTFVQGPTHTSSQHLVALGFYGPKLEVRHGSFGGWKAFGPVRRVTRAEGNILFALDGERALDVYRRYLGDYAAGLPATGLLLPLSVLGDGDQPTGLVRTIVGVDEAHGSLTLAGHIDAGGRVRLMHASTEALVDGAKRAAELVLNGAAAPPGRSMAILISCVGRKLAMGARVDEEVEAVVGVLGPACVVTGFYSNGEISPFSKGTDCKLHNQTMTITLLCEA